MTATFAQIAEWQRAKRSLYAVTESGAVEEVSALNYWVAQQLGIADRWRIFADAAEAEREADQQRRARESVS